MADLPSTQSDGPHLFRAVLDGYQPLQLRLLDRCNPHNLGKPTSVMIVMHIQPVSETTTYMWLIMSITALTNIYTGDVENTSDVSRWKRGFDWEEAPWIVESSLRMAFAWSESVE
jgi:hypothetical protein